MSSISEHIESDDAKKSSLWWLKSTVRTVKSQNPQINITTPKGAETNITSPNKQLEIDISSSIDEYLENDPMYSTGRTDDASDADIGSIIEEINKLASQSPIGHYENTATDKSVEEILQEAEKIYIESSKSFEQLSSKSKSSLDISLSKSSSLTFKSKKSTPSPKSNFSNGKIVQDFEKLDVIADNNDEPALDLEQKINFDNEQTIYQNDNEPLELNNNEDDLNIYEDEEFDFESVSEKDEDMNFIRMETGIENKVFDQKYFETYLDNIKKSEKLSLEKLIPNINEVKEMNEADLQEKVELVSDNVPKEKSAELIIETEKNEVEKEAIQEMRTSPDPEEDIGELRHEIEELKIQLQETKEIIKNNEILINKKSYSLQQELDETIEQLKDTREQNTVLQLQLDNLTKTHQELKTSYDELFTTKKNLELKIIEIESNLMKCKSELLSVKENNVKLSESETNLKKLLEIERLQSKTARLQNEKDTKCIQDLNRQVKEMERIIQRKQPDSLSTLILPNKTESEANVAARTLLENRIKQLEQEAHMRELQSNNVFTEIQDKFNQMKDKYERHIEDLEVHVNDLKQQLRSKNDTYDIYTQTYIEEPAHLKEECIKELFDIGVQTDKVESAKQAKTMKKPEKIIDNKEDTHLIATIRGLQADLTSKDKLYIKLQKELEELRKTNRKLQKDRETNLRIVPERKEKSIANSKSPEPIVCNEINDDLKSLKDERDKLKVQLCRLEDDFQNLKTKRLQDLNILQEAHEREVTTYMSNIGPMREQLNVQQISINNLQKQLATAKEELAIITVERDHLDSRIKNINLMNSANGSEDEATQISLQKKIAYLERRYEEREIRLRAIVHGLAQKHVTGRDCPQCAARQQQLIGYKAELDQLLATLRFQKITII